MKLEQRIWTEADGWREISGSGLDGAAQVVLAFGSPALLRDAGHLDRVRALYPEAHVLSASTAGEICGTRVCDDSVVTTAVRLEHSGVEARRLHIGDAADSYAAGRELAASFPAEELVHLLVISDGLHVNGSELVRGLTDALPAGVTVTGGLAGDGDRFQATLVGLDEAPREGVIAALGLYGSRVKVGFGSLGGWDPFGPERIVTRSTGNVLYELNGTSALELYKRYLGEHAAGLPASALLFPLSLRVREGDPDVVRTIVGIDEETQSMTFAGDVPEGSVVRFMKANFNRLIDGATGAARTTYDAIGADSPDLAILISCVGRKLVLRQRTEEELEGVREVLGDRSVLAGFYSYGEISPFTPSTRCELHNQTMTITAVSER